jgi:hypothetical protein
VVWGTDWPHINYFEAQQVPDDGALVNLLARWLPDEAHAPARAGRQPGGAVRLSPAQVEPQRRQNQGSEK